MNLDDISERYQKNLEKFFNDERVIEHIYKEQYGEESYEQHKEQYKKEYKDIIQNTVFIPHVSLEKLNRFLLSQANKYGQDYVKEHFPEELKLSVRLNAKKREIAQQYTNMLIEELMEATKNGINIEKDKLSKDNFYNNVKLIEENITYKKGSIVDHFKKKKIDSIIKKYTEAYKGKMIVETTSFFKNRRDCSDNKYYPGIMLCFEKDNGFIISSIGKDESKNCRYVFLPIFEYRNRNDYLTLIIHEIMHISKGRINKDRYESGLHRSYMSNSEKSGELQTQASGAKGNIQFVGDMIRGVKQSMQWLLYKRARHKKLNDEVFYKATVGDSQSEEALHHYQARKVAEAIIADGLDSMLEMPYDRNLSGNTEISYEQADNVTEKFMENFKEDFQKVNRGEMSIESFKKKIGRRNYGLLSTFYQANNKKMTVQEMASVLAAYKHDNENARINQEDYDELGFEIIDKMKKRAERYSDKGKSSRKTPIGEVDWER